MKQDELNSTLPNRILHNLKSIFLLYLAIHVMYILNPDSV
jgi:hypothetical protein